MRGQRELGYNEEKNVVHALALVMVIVLLAFRIVSANLIGDMANGIMNLILVPVAFLSIVLFYSVGKAESKLIERRIEKEQLKNCGGVLRSTLLLVSVVGLILSALFFFFSEQISRKMVASTDISLVTKYFSLSFLLLACVCALYGYFDGNGQRKVNQICFIVFVVVLCSCSYLFAGKCNLYGKNVSEFLRNTNYEHIYTATGIAFTIVFALFLSLLVYFVFYLLGRDGFRRKMVRDKTKYRENPFVILKLLFESMLPIWITGLLVFLPGFLHFLFYVKNLNSSDQEARIISDMNVFFGQFFTIFLLPICICFITAKRVSDRMFEAYINKEMSSVKGICAGEVQLQVGLAGIWAALMIVMAKPISSLFFGEKVLQDLTLYCRVGGVLVLTATLAITNFYLISGMKRKRKLYLQLLIACVAQILAALFFEFALNAGLVGLICSEIVFTLILVLLQERALLKFARFHQEWIHSIIFPLVIAFACAAIGLGISVVFASPLGTAFATGLGMIVAIVIYVFAYLRLIGFRKKEIALIPGGNVVKKIMQILRM